MTKDEVIQAFMNFLDTDDWKYEYVEEKSLFRTNLNIKCKLKHVNYVVYATDDGSLVSLCICPFNADEENRMAVCEYLTRANYGLRHGNFELDMGDGEVRYKLSISTADCEELSHNSLERMLFLPAMMFDRYGDGLTALIMGFSDPVTEIEKAESNN